MKRQLAALILFAGAGTLTTGCAMLDMSCDDYMGYDEIMESWVGDDLMKYERQVGVRPFSTLKRPQNRTEYSYKVKDEWIGDMHNECTNRFTADDETGEIVDWSYSGNACYG